MKSVRTDLSKWGNNFNLKNADDRNSVGKYGYIILEYISTVSNKNNRHSEMLTHVGVIQLFSKFATKE